LKKILIISPHFPPSNLAAVHRSRLFAQHLPSFGWSPTILTVHEDFYEEKLDHHLEKLLPAKLQIEKVKAYKTTKPRVIGDIGLRAFFQLYKRAKYLIEREAFDFLYIPIPSFYVALLGRWLHSVTGIAYGIDYIDPWVHHFPGSDKIFSRHWFSTNIAALLEPIAVKKAALITGVAEGYYNGVQDRNPFLLKQAVFAAMPYGGEKRDHEKLHELGLQPYLFKKKPGKVQLVYAGAMLPKAYQPLKAILYAIQQNRAAFTDLEIHFIGSGKSPNDTKGFNIKPFAEKYDLWENVIFEYPARIPYLDVLIHLEAGEGAFIMGSTEPHYTPSKVYQAVLSKKPIWAILHQQSSACQVIRQSGAGIVLDFDGEQGVNTISASLLSSYTAFIDFKNNYNYTNVDQEQFEKYSAKSVTAMLAKALNSALLS